MVLLIDRRAGPDAWLTSCAQGGVIVLACIVGILTGFLLAPSSSLDLRWPCCDGACGGGGVVPRLLSSEADASEADASVLRSGLKK